MAASAQQPMVNYYALLGIAKDADEAAIRKAYRKRALELHPDKNPDNPKAEELFMAIKVASDALLDKQKRAELDTKLAAQEATAARFRAMDDARAKMRNQLESREKAAAATSFAARQAAAAAHSELERLRRQGREAQSAYAEHLQTERAGSAGISIPVPPRSGASGVPGRAGTASAAAGAVGGAPGDDSEPDFDISAAVRVKWSSEVGSRMGEESMTDGPSGAGSSTSAGAGAGAAGGALRQAGAASATTTLSERQLRSLFKLYGQLRLILARKARSACLVFDSLEAAEAAVAVPPDGFRVTRLTMEGSGAGVGAETAGHAGEYQEAAGGADAVPVPQPAADGGASMPQAPQTGATRAGQSSTAAVGAGYKRPRDETDAFPAASGPGRGPGAGQQGAAVGLGPAGAGGTGQALAGRAGPTGLLDLDTPPSIQGFLAREAAVLATMQRLAAARS